MISDFTKRLSEKYGYFYDDMIEGGDYGGTFIFSGEKW